MAVGDPHDGADRQGLEALPHAEILGQRAPGRPQLGVGDRHLEGGGQHPVHRRAAEELCHTRRGGELTAPGRRRFVQAGHAQVHRRPLHRRQGRIDGRALLQGGALAPALAFLGDDPDEEQRTHPVHAGGGADGLTEREVDLDELHAGEPHGAGAPTPSP